MKRRSLLFLLPVCFMLYACPFESTVPMAVRPAEEVDSSLLGYWYGIVKDGSDYFGIEALDITKKSDSVYDIVRYGKAVKGDIILPDTAHFYGYISYIGDQRYMNIEGSIVNVITHGKKPAELITQKIYYVSALAQQHDTLTVQTVSEGFSPTRKIFRSPDEFRQAIIDQSAKGNIFDDLYTLSYHKIPRPAGLKAF
jgi:hypothetical protein